MLSAKLTNQERKAIYRREGYRCALCDSTRYLQIHHVISRGSGGTNHPHNLICLCSDCHAMVHGINLNDWPTTPEDVEQAIVEYLSDLYAEEGEVWNPYRNPYAKQAGKARPPPSRPFFVVPYLHVAGPGPAHPGPKGRCVSERAGPGQAPVPVVPPSVRRRDNKVWGPHPAPRAIAHPATGPAGVGPGRAAAVPGVAPGAPVPGCLAAARAAACSGPVPRAACRPRAGVARPVGGPSPPSGAAGVLPRRPRCGGAGPGGRRAHLAARSVPRGGGRGGRSPRPAASLRGELGLGRLRPSAAPLPPRAGSPSPRPCRAARLPPWAAAPSSRRGRLGRAWRPAWKQPPPPA